MKTRGFVVATGYAVYSTTSTITATTGASMNALSGSSLG